MAGLEEASEGGRMNTHTHTHTDTHTYTYTYTQYSLSDNRKKGVGWMDWWILSRVGLLRAIKYH